MTEPPWMDSPVLRIAGVAGIQLCPNHCFWGAVSEWKKETIEYYRAIPNDFHGSFHCDVRVEKFGYAYALNDVQQCHLSVDHVGLTLNDQPRTIEKHRKVTHLAFI